MDSTRLFVSKHLHEYFRKAEINSELKNSLKRHPKVDEMIDNLTRQFKGVHEVRLKKGKPKLKDKTLIDAIQDFGSMIIKAIEKKADESMMSEIEKYQTKHENDDIKDMQSTLEGKSTGVFEDMGLEIPEDQQDFTENHIKEPIPEGRVISIGKG